MSIRQLSRWFLTAAVLLWSLSLSAASDFRGPSRDANGNVTPPPKGEQCIRPTEEIRRKHPDLLLHKRDLTMHQGIRTKDASLKECINCHVTPDSSGKVARAGEPGFFCSSCHQSVSVKLDCFECHSDRPESAVGQLSREVSPHQGKPGPMDRLLSLSNNPKAISQQKVQ